MENKKVEKILGRARRLEHAAKDSDGDGVNNILDCQPYNPKKQGIIHNLAVQYGKGRIKKWGEEGQADELSRRETRSEAREVAREERRKQEIETARLKEEQRGKRKREYIKSGGFAGQLAKAIKSSKPSTTKKNSISYKKKKSKKGKMKKTKLRKISYDFTTGGYRI